MSRAAKCSCTETRSFTYSGSDLATETTPEAGTVTYTYDNNHHVTQRTDAKGQQTQYTYDTYERLTEVRHYTQPPANEWRPKSEDQTQRVDYYYDTPVTGPPDWTQNNTWGRLSAVAFHQGETINGANFAYEYTYNQACRVPQGNRLLISNYADTTLSEIAQYAWDDHGRMTQMTYPSGLVMNYQFDGMSRTVGMTETMPGGALSLAAYATFGSASQLLTLGYGTNVSPFTESRTYNNLLQLTHLTVNGGVDMQYIYSTGHNNGRVTQTIDGALGETVNYTYDNLHRLLTATATNSAWGESYSYDGFGNLTAKTPTVGSAPAYTGLPNGATNATGPVYANGKLPNRPRH